MTDTAQQRAEAGKCSECGMSCLWGDYHPYAACLMFKQCHNSETVLANLRHVQAVARMGAIEEASNIVRDEANRCGSKAFVQVVMKTKLKRIADALDRLREGR